MCTWPALLEDIIAHVASKASIRSSWTSNETFLTVDMKLTMTKVFTPLFLQIFSLLSECDFLLVSEFFAFCLTITTSSTKRQSSIRSYWKLFWKENHLNLHCSSSLVLVLSFWKNNLLNCSYYCPLYSNHQTETLEYKFT